MPPVDQALFEMPGIQQRTKQSQELTFHSGYLRSSGVIQETNKSIKEVTWQDGKDTTGSGEWGAGREGCAGSHRLAGEGSSERQHLSREPR